MKKKHILLTVVTVEQPDRPHHSATLYPAAVGQVTLILADNGGTYLAV